jgi:hypothetical protein
MDDSELYTAPSRHLLAEPAGPRPALSILRAFSIVIASGAGFGTAGIGIGYILGVLAPSYYRGVFPNGNDPGFDPVQVGVGLGFSQGAICGVLVGMVVILAVAISGRPWISSGKG